MTKKTDRPSSAVRIRVMKRDRFRCTYCGASGNDSELEVDHIIPVSRGGSNHMSNLTTACASCNRKKGASSMSPTVQTQSSGSVLAGKWIIGFDPKYPKTDISYLALQGKILSVEDGQVIVQKYGLDSSRPIDIEAFPKSSIYDKTRFQIFGDELSMIEKIQLIELKSGFISQELYHVNIKHYYQQFDENRNRKPSTSHKGG